MMTVFERVSEVVCQQFGVETVKPETTFEELGADSLDLSEMVMELETEFDITVSDDWAPKSVQEVVDYVETLKT
jgi:acyl carrier protein